MKTSRFHVARMDCAAEEQLVRLALGDVGGIDSMQFDLDARTVAVVHETDPGVLLQALEPLDLDTTPLGEDAGGPVAAVPARAIERRALTIALVINAVFFAAELAAGLLAGSMGLVADSLDMLADASVYTLSLLAVGGPAVRKQRLAAGSGYLQLTLAVAGLAEVARRVLTDEPLPDVATMVVVAALALAANLATLLVLQRARSPEAHFQASWIFTTNDIKVNALVIVSAVVVSLTSSAVPDLLAGALIFAIVANGARRILALARRPA